MLSATICEGWAFIVARVVWQHWNEAGLAIIGGLVSAAPKHFPNPGRRRLGSQTFSCNPAAKYVPPPSVSGDAASQASPDKVRPTSITTWSNKPEIPPPVWSASLILEQELVGDITRRVLSTKLDFFLPFTMFSRQN